MNPLVIPELDLNPGAFAFIYRREARFVARTLRARGVPNHDVEDAVQEVFLILYLRFTDVRAECTIRPWLGSVARYVSQNRLRTLRRRHRAGIGEELDADVLADAAGLRPDAKAEALGRYRCLVKAIGELDPEKREIYVLAEVEELSPAAIGHKIDLPVSTVYSRLRKARAEIREKLVKRGL